MARDCVSTDVGSLPKPEGFSEKLFFEDVSYFNRIVKEGLMKKLNSGVQVPCYPQYQAMDSQFFRLYEKIKHVDDVVFETEGETLYNPIHLVLPEIQALKESAFDICQKTGLSQLRIKVCVSDFLTLQEKLDDRFIASVLVANVVDAEYLKTQIVTLDAPCYGTSFYVGQDYLSRYENIFRTVKLLFPNIETGIHLHSSSQKDFLSMKHLDVIDLHADELAVVSRQDLEKNGKVLQVGIVRTREPDLPDSLNAVVDRLDNALLRFGSNVKHVSAECGMGGWQSEEKALINLGLVEKALKVLRGEGSK